MNGKLIIFEGVEGCGKTSQMQFCYEWLQSLCIPVIMTRQPGGTELGLHLRRLLLEKTDNQAIADCASRSAVGDRTELLLYAADRSQHVEQFLKPNLAAGKIILCDRYIYSTIAYQGYGRGLDMGLINQLNSIATGGLASDLTFWLDVDAEVGLSRKRKGGDKFDRIEQETIDFHHRVQQGYTALATSDDQTFVRIDGSLTKQAVQQEIQKVLENRLQVWEGVRE
jgi:dTMP kinase